MKKNLFGGGQKMQEKQKELFDQYDMELLHVRKGRGGLICETKNGSYDLLTCQYSPKRLEQAFEIKEALIAQGMKEVDQYERNKEGELLSYDRYQTAYIMKRHINGRECDVHNLDDLKLAGEQLSKMHEYLKTIAVDGYTAKKNQFYQKTRELIHTRQYILHQNEKKEFEKLFVQYFDLFQKEIKPSKKISYTSFLCHGSCQYHHFLVTPEQKMATIQFENFYVGNQMDDLFQFMRKILEKNQYNSKYADALLNAYQRNQRLNEEQYEYLYDSLSYPEKYWKLANQYMNHRKTFLSPKLTEKLKEAVSLQEKKEKFLYHFRLKYL
jgi:CotS family spore coat protein